MLTRHVTKNGLSESTVNEWAAGKYAFVESISSGKEGGIVYKKGGCFLKKKSRPARIASSILHINNKDFFFFRNLYLSTRSTDASITTTETKFP